MKVTDLRLPVVHGYGGRTTYERMQRMHSHQHMSAQARPQHMQGVLRHQQASTSTWEHFMSPGANAAATYGGLISVLMA